MARSKHIPADGPSQADRVRELHAMVREARTLLTNPTKEALDACRSRLEEAVTALGRLQSSLPSGDWSRDRALAAPLGALRTEIAGVQILLDGAAAFYTGWMRLASSMASGYTADGSPAPSGTAHRVLVEA
jgi:hypothetical protein